MLVKLRQWATPLISGSLIIAAFILARVLGPVAHDVLMVAAAAIAGFPIVIKAIRALGARVVGIDLLVSIAAIGAVIIGEYWEAAAVTFLFAIGHTLEVSTLNKTRSALAELIAVAPDTAVVLREGSQQVVPAHEVRTGEIVVVKNGAKIPVDGVVVSGMGSVDEATITGESIPVEKVARDNVFAGTIARSGLLQVEATGVGADTTLARIIHRVEEAQDSQAPTAKFMDRFSAWYTPAIIVFALLAGLISGDVKLALTLLVISCPGALVISIPVSIVAGIGRAARDGVLIKGGEYLETAAKIDAVALDKTGTLTHGKPELTDVVVLDHSYSEDDVLNWAAIAEAGSEHPLAAAILNACTTRGLKIPEIADHTESVPGQGIIARNGHHTILVGNLAMMHSHQALNSEQANQIEQASHVASELAERGRTPMIVAVDQKIIGVLAVADTIRPEAELLVGSLKKVGVSTVLMLTGDAPAVARGVANDVGINQVAASLLPEDKLNAIHELQTAGHTVAMVGDGVNDAPALAAANIGVAMGAAGSAVAVETADIALMGDRLLNLPYAIGIAKRTINNMRQNIVIALATVAVLLLGVLFGGVTMAIGMLVHEISVLVVIVNAMRLLRARPHHGLAQDRTQLRRGSPSEVTEVNLMM